MSILASASFSQSAATLEAAASTAFGKSEHSTSDLMPTPAEALLGLSCIISARGEVQILLSDVGISADLTSKQAL